MEKFSKEQLDMMREGVAWNDLILVSDEISQVSLEASELIKQMDVVDLEEKRDEVFKALQEKIARGTELSARRQSILARLESNS